MMQQLAPNQASAEVPINDNFKTLSHQAVYGNNPATSSGLTWGYYGGRWSGFSVAAGTLSLAASQTNHVVVARATGVISTSTSATNWNNDVDYARVYKIVTGGSAVTSFEDHRAGAGGVHGGGSGAGTKAIPQNIQSGNYTLTIDDSGKHLLHPSGAGSGDTFTIPSNASVPFDIGTVVVFVNLDSNAISIAINSDTLRFVSDGTTGSRSLAQYGIATVIKVDSTNWLIRGVGLT